MSSNPLKDYLGRIKSDSERDSAARNKRIADWQKSVRRLYETIKEMTAGQATPVVQPNPAYEQRLGSYTIDHMMLEVGPVRLSLVPKGSVLIGADGRVDMTGPRGVVRFIRLVKDGHDNWFVALQAVRPRDLAPLDATSLALAFRTVIDGPDTASRAGPARSAPRSRRR